MHDSIYEPAEDSYLLQSVVQKFASDKVLDIGTGSGILAKEAATNEKVSSVTAIDVNKKSISFNEKENNNEKIEWINEDTFSFLKANKKKFGTVICNPPYLPTEKKAPDLALDGGKHGYEYTVKLISSVGDSLTADGQFLLLFSTLTKKDKVEEALETHLFEWEEVAKQQVSFETLYVYRITKNTVFKELEQRGVSSISPLAQGKRGVVVKGLLNDKEVAIKLQRSSSEALDTIKKESNWIKKVNELSIGPNYIDNNEKYLLMEFVDGTPFEQWIQEKSKKDIIAIIKKLVEQMKTLDENGWQKEEMHHPTKHIIVRDDEPVLIDFERMRVMEHPHNTTQFLQYLCGSRVSKMLANKEIELNIEKTRNLCQEYKHEPKKLQQEFLKLL